MTFNASANIVEVNRYDFQVEAETAEQAETKLRKYLETHCPYPSFTGVDDDSDIICTDREAGMVTEETKSITIK